MNGKHPERFNDMSIEEYDKKAKGEEGKTEPQKTETNTDRLRNILNS